MNAFIRQNSQVDQSNMVRLSSLDNGTNSMFYEVTFRDITITTEFYQLQNYPSGFSFMEAHVGLHLRDFQVAYNDLKPIFRSILHNKTPLLLDTINNSMKTSVEEGDVFFGKNGDVWNVILPIVIDLSKCDFSTHIINGSLALAHYIIEMLLNIKGSNVSFIDLSSIISDINKLNDSHFLHYAKQVLPYGVQN